MSAADQARGLLLARPRRRGRRAAATDRAGARRRLRRGRRRPLAARGGRDRGPRRSRSCRRPARSPASRSTASSTGRSRRRSRSGALPGPFDTICCYDVLEHLVDPASALLRQLRGLAEPGGAAAHLDPQRAPLLARLRPRGARHVRLHRVRPPRRDAPALVHAPRPRRAGRRPRAGRCSGSRATWRAGTTARAGPADARAGPRVPRAAVAPAGARRVTVGGGLRPQLERARGHAALPGVAARGAGVIVADNGSTDGSVEAIRAAFPDVELVENGANLGFCGGNNAAIRRALERGAEWVVLLNNDAEAEPGMLAALQAAAARHPRAGVLAGKLLYPDGRVQWAGQRVGLRTGYSGRPRGHGQPDGFAYSVEGRTDRAVGALMAVSRDGDRARGAARRRPVRLRRGRRLVAAHPRGGLRVRVRAGGPRRAPRCSASTGGRRRRPHRLLRHAQHDRGVRAAPAVAGRAGTAAAARVRARRFLAHAALVLRSGAAVRAVLDGWRDARAGRLGRELRLGRGEVRPGLAGLSAGIAMRGQGRTAADSARS